MAFQVFDGRLWKNNGCCGKIDPDNVGGPILWNKNLIYVKFSPWMLCTTKQLHEASYLLELCLSIATLTFFELDDADLFAELRKKLHSKVEIIGYYDGEWIQFLQSHHFSVEVYDFYCGYRCVIICGSLVDSAGCYHDDCVIKVSADTVEYQWHT